LARPDWLLTRPGVTQQPHRSGHPKHQDRESKRGGQHGGSCTDSNALPAP
jgi:hypothetical protein